MDWRIYYDDGSVYEGEPENAPGLGVICIVQPDPDVGRHVLSKWDYYWWQDGEWWGGDLFGLFDYLHSKGFKVVKFGRTVSNALYKEIIARAVADKGFPLKSAWRKDERR